jgi:ABC-type glycerol-3-phosphate transport system permease component
MPLLSVIGRRSWRVRALIGGIYALLLGGAATMVYPFLLLIAGGTKTAADMPETRPVPGFLTDETALYRKHVEGLFNESLVMLRSTYGPEATSFRTLEPPDAINPGLVAEWARFLAAADLPPEVSALGYLHTPASRGAVPSALREFRRRMLRRCGGDLGRLNAEMGTGFANWNAFCVVPDDYLARRSQPADTPLRAACQAFKEEQPAARRYYFSPEGFFRTAYLQAQYGRDIGGYNAAHGTRCAAWEDVHLDRRCPGPERGPRERQDWERFVRDVLNLLWIRADAAAAPAYRQFLRAKYGSLERLNRRRGTAWTTFDEVPFPEAPPEDGPGRSDWEAFLQGWRDPDRGDAHKLAAEHIRVHSVEFLFRDYLQAKYGSLGAMNGALGCGYGAWAAVPPPQREFHYLDFARRKGALRREFVLRNFRSVLDYMALHGRALSNTALYCGLAVLGALIVNPLAAYALSRYRPPSAYKLLLFLMLTMAFPPMVTQIPVFLMLRQFHLLNTFWALVLPGLASGYGIFLLKGFFDSLPRELYESAALDGAGELRIFWQITMSLSRPILAVVALSAFTQAYGNFMFALLICQDERMWTLMPWLYQLQQRSGQGIVFASLLVAAAPAFLVFAFCQKVIMRGIVVPVEK